MLEYGNYLLISRPQFDPRLGYVVFMRARCGYHQFDRPTNTFMTQDDALTFGFAIARKWVDQRNPI